MPTGVALHDAREQLFAAARRVLIRDGASALTSRAVTEAAGVAKGVLHRHFDDFDAFLAELVRAHIAELRDDLGDLAASAGSATVVAILSDALTLIFAPTTLGLVRLIVARDALRSRLRATTPRGLPLLTEAAEGIAAYLAAEQHLGRITADTDVTPLSLSLIGTGHLLFAGELGGLPDTAAVREIVEAITVGVVPGVQP